MKHRLIRTVLTAVALIVAASLTIAETTAPLTKTPSQAVAAKTAPKPAVKKGQQAAKIKIIDINSASKAELMKIPGVSKVYAAKIISGRPYLSKSHLLTRKILPAGVYASIKEQVAVKDPAKALRDLRKAGKIK